MKPELLIHNQKRAAVLQTPLQILNVSCCSGDGKTVKFTASLEQCIRGLSIPLGLNPAVQSSPLSLSLVPRT